MHKDDIQTWLLNWFNQQVTLPTYAATANFFDAGWIDSFKIFTLINDMETTFKIHFDDTIFQDARFATIQGLSEIIFELTPTLFQT